MYFLYSTLLAAALLLGSPYWLYHALRYGKYRRGLGERMGFAPARIRNTKPAIWVHAVSVGEVLAVSGLVRQLATEFPGHRIVISTTTDTGQQLAAARFGRENTFYFPFDFKFCVRRYFEALRPGLIVLAETEFWPNLLCMARAKGTRVAVVNARISDRSFPGYRRWRKFFSRILSGIDLFLTQTPTDAERLREIGAPAERVFVSGNLKFDVSPPAQLPIVNELRAALQRSGAGPVLACGSTVEGEERSLLEAFAAVLRRHPDATMLLAPRHPERFDAVADLLRNSPVKFLRRSKWTSDALNGSVLLIDSIGELAGLYALADVAFVGGSLVPRGGHSILEPAQYGVAILVGPHTENFRDIVALFRDCDAVRVVGAADLGNVLTALFEDEAERSGIGRRALETLQSQRGATQFTLAKLRTLVDDRVFEAHTV
jgi:3-deoxy-D-manno-octulosonic-acid transferase